MTNKQVLITGASSGLGLEISKHLTEMSFDVIGVGRRSLDHIKDHINAFSRYVQTDLTKIGFEELIRLEINPNKPLILINNLGKSEWKSIERIDNAFLEEMYKVNLKSTFQMCKLAASFSNLESIVNVASIAGRRGTPNNSVYSAMKFGVIGLTQSLAKELGKRNIRVNSVSPVLVLTPGLEDALNGYESPSYYQGTQAFLEHFTATQSALNRLPTTLEVSQTIRWLISEEASAITGQNLNVDCGVFPQ